MQIIKNSKGIMLNVWLTIESFAVNRPADSALLLKGNGSNYEGWQEKKEKREGFFYFEG